MQQRQVVGRRGGGGRRPGEGRWAEGGAGAERVARRPLAARAQPGLEGDRRQRLEKVPGAGRVRRRPQLLRLVLVRRRRRRIESGVAGEVPGAWKVGRVGENGAAGGVVVARNKAAAAAAAAAEWW